MCSSSSHIHCPSIVRPAPPLASARSHNHRTERTLPATLPGSLGQRSLVASGFLDNSQAVPKTEVVCLPPLTFTLHSLQHTESAFVPKLLCTKAEPGVSASTQTFTAKLAKHLNTTTNYSETTIDAE